MRLLMLNWRDPWHPKAGGAELLTLRILQHLSRENVSAEWFSARYPGAPVEELRDGIRFVRGGSQATTHLAAWRRYRGTSSFDVVVDQINTIPFYAHRYVRVPAVALMHQLAQEVWRYEFSRPLGGLGLVAERYYLRPYRHEHIMTVSRSSKASMRSIGLEGPIYVLPAAVDTAALDAVPKKADPRDIVTLGRITPSKRPDHAIRAAALLSARGWEGRLIMIGSGDERFVARMRNLGSSLLGSRYVMTGRVSDDRRAALLRDASCIWMTSVREGWGLAITEAARSGTPAVVYRVGGLVDSVDDGKTGYVVDQDPLALANATARLFANDYAAFAERALEVSRAYSFEATAEHFLTAVNARIEASVATRRTTSGR